jgi:hypothetical protein
VALVTIEVVGDRLHRRRGMGSMLCKRICGREKIDNSDTQPSRGWVGLILMDKEIIKYTLG